jgi:zinc transport system substrate-binding protein
MMLAAAFILAGKPPGKIKKDAVAVTVFPIYDLVREIAPKGVDVVLLLPPGTSPHTFEPSPSTLKALERSRVLFAVGNGLDTWAAAMAKTTETPVVANYSGVQLRNYDESEEHEDEHEDGHEEGEADEHEHEGIDPHFWLSMDNGIAMTATITQRLIQEFPEYRDRITARHNSMLGRLREANREIDMKLSGIENRKMVTLHGAWYYFAEDFGLEVISTFSPSAGQEPTPQYLANLDKTIREAGTDTIYSEPQLSHSVLESFIADHELRLAVLDPLGGVEGRASYIEMMLYNADIIAQHQ